MQNIKLATPAFLILITPHSAHCSALNLVLINAGVRNVYILLGAQKHEANTT